jgi:hypothetical protein
MRAWRPRRGARDRRASPAFPGRPSPAAAHPPRRQARGRAWPSPALAARRQRRSAWARCRVWGDRRPSSSSWEVRFSRGRKLADCRVLRRLFSEGRAQLESTQSNLTFDCVSGTQSNLVFDCVSGTQSNLALPKDSKAVRLGAMINAREEGIGFDCVPETQSNLTRPQANPIAPRVSRRQRQLVHIAIGIGRHPCAFRRLRFCLK